MIDWGVAALWASAFLLDVVIGLAIWRLFA
jgi:hypothetical protein